MTTEELGRTGDFSRNAEDSSRMLAALDLREVTPQRGDVAWSATTQYVPWPKAYGGDMAAQATLAMLRSAPEDRSLHSLHSYFMRPVDIGAEITYEVEVIRDGRSYSTRHVRAVQNDKDVYLSIGSLTPEADGAEFHTPLSEAAAPLGRDIPDPESLPSSAEVLPDSADPAADYWARGRSFDMRHVPGPLYLEHDEDRSPHQAVWVRSYDQLPDEPALHQAALTYACDYTILEPSLRAQGLCWSSPGLVTASLDHAMWFHRPARVDQWLLYLQESLDVGRQRGLSLGRFYTRGGELVATVAQEGLIRPGSQ
ncbi:acyl-CoA thioesterase [Nesterenkonia marinintestina]|uniref:acyl-CoA thioesterase n=1 Tax=Nesterenkonia marinintestina TaxID=2979865 RepID=UPI0028FC22F2|nr:acyl-CoA thioesterase domain-containing protein [Nesterenkonia sp. GX14115]